MRHGHKVAIACSGERRDVEAPSAGAGRKGGAPPLEDQHVRMDEEQQRSLKLLLLDESSVLQSGSHPGDSPRPHGSRSVVAEEVPHSFDAEEITGAKTARSPLRCAECDSQLSVRMPCGTH